MVNDDIIFTIFGLLNPHYKKSQLTYIKDSIVLWLIRTRLT